VVVFPGSNCDADAWHALRLLGAEAKYLWHADRDLGGVDAVILPGGFSYGDYLRAGAIARFAPIMAAVERHAAKGGLVLGICNGFQILLEAGLLPGAMRRNDSLQFRCQMTSLRVERTDTPFTSLAAAGQVIRVPIAHAEGNYYADAATLAAIEGDGQVVFRYVNEAGQADAAANPNGAVNNIAGLLNRAGNVLGMMPHPERVVEPLLGGSDGRLVLGSMLQALGMPQVGGGLRG
jgi:phosphoribosylformylglycinamidine synthase